MKERLGQASIRVKIPGEARGADANLKVTDSRSQQHLKETKQNPPASQKEISYLVSSSPSIIT